MEDGMDSENRVAGNPDNNDDDPDHRGGSATNMRCIKVEIGRCLCRAAVDPVVADEVISPTRKPRVALRMNFELFLPKTACAARSLGTSPAAPVDIIVVATMIRESQRVPLSATMVPITHRQDRRVQTWIREPFLLALMPQQSDIERIGMRLLIWVFYTGVFGSPLLYF
ncbi:T-complex 11 [Penicillium coprophilum]|uniref:T-complex 11 n=1 Tax=Penicillium coprophilum TaxID=36646 RepID=UPI002399CB48|nr:T-complex 11 [Penicillium coprophilum]KAJ5171590.1 T-complex 11 [Penicillium coprophilum]